MRLPWWDWDITSGNEVYNNVLPELLEYEVDEIKPHISWWKNKIHHLDLKQVDVDLQEHFKGKTDFYINEHRLKTKSNKWKWFLDYGKVIERDKDGQPIRMIGTLRVIEEQKNTEKELQKAKEEAEESGSIYLKLFSEIPDGVYKSSHEGRFIDVNPAMVDMLGYSSKEELLKVDIKNDLYFDASDRESLTLDEIQKELGVYRMRKKDGSEIWVEDHGWYTLDDLGNILYHEGVLRDATDRIKAEQRVIKDKNRFQKTLDAIDAVVYVADMDTYELLFLNKKGKELAGDKLGQKCYSVLQKGVTSPCEFCTNHLLLDNEDKPKPPYVWEFQNTVTNRWYQLSDQAIHWADDKLARIEIATDITKLKKVEQALKESEEHSRQNNELLRSIMESPKGMIIFSLDPQYRYTAFTVSHKETMKYIWGVDIKVGMSMLEIIHKDGDREKAKLSFDLALRGEHIILIEEYGADDLHRTWWENRYSPIYSDTNTILGLTVFVTDITESKQLEDALLENQHRFEKAQALGHVGNWDYNIESELFWISDETKRIYGFDLDSNNFSMEQVENCIPERERTHQTLFDLIAHDKKFDLEHEIIPADKTPRKIVHSIAELERDASNNPLRVRGVILDITERKKAEQALKESEYLYKETQKIGKMGGWSYNVESDQMILTDTIYDIYGKKILTAEEGIQYYHPDDKEKVWNSFSEAISKQKPYDLEVRFINAQSDNLFVRTIGQPIIKNGKVVKIYGNLINITEQKTAELKLKESEAQLKELNSTKDKLFSIIAHDLRSPFNGILGFSDLLIANVREYEIAKSERYLGIINSASKNALILLDNLLNWGKAQSGQIVFKPEKIILSSIIQEVIETSNSMEKIKDISLNQMKSVEIEVYADENMLSVVLRNLISNAIKFTETGGNVNILFITVENQVEISISDDGVGMNKEKLNGLFNISTNITTRGTANEKGSGLGLVLCKEFVEKLGGKIWVESELGKGSIFKFTLPLHKAE